MVHTLGPTEPLLHVYGDLHATSAALAREAVERANRAIAQTGRFTIVLSGGDTPRQLYSLLATEYRDAIPWANIHVFWGDERWVPHDHPDSNFRMAQETLLWHVPMPSHQIHPMPTDLADTDAAANAYEALLRRRFERQLPAFDLILLGLGSDGHTASLFPNSPALAETCRWAVPAEAPTEPKHRLTLTLPVLCNAAYVAFLVAGADKQSALRMALDSATAPVLCPAAAVRPHSGHLHFYADRSAASG